MLLKGLVWVAREIMEASQQAEEDEAVALRQDLTRMYSMLEAGQMTDAEFDVQEREIMERLDRIDEERA